MQPILSSYIRQIWKQYLAANHNEPRRPNGGNHTFITTIDAKFTGVIKRPSLSPIAVSTALQPTRLHPVDTHSMKQTKPHKFAPTSLRAPTALLPNMTLYCNQELIPQQQKVATHSTQICPQHTYRFIQTSPWPTYTQNSKPNDSSSENTPVITIPKQNRRIYKRSSNIHLTTEHNTTTGPSV